MKKSEILKYLTINKIGDDNVFIQNKYFNFYYQIADTIVKEEYKGKYRYLGGLQCYYNEGSEEYKNLEKRLCEIAEKILL